MKRIANEPLAHFLIIGLAVFALFAFLGDAPIDPGRQEIVVTEEMAVQLAAGFQAVWRRPPTPNELDGLIDDHIREEVFVREALALGLDRNDTVVRRRLRQKMEFLTEAAAEALTPSDEALRAHYTAHAELFSTGPRLAFQQVFLGEVPGEADIDAARDLLASSTDPRGAGVRTLLPFEMPVSPPTAVDGTFGRGFFDALIELEPGTWSGPVRSGFGAHLVRLTQRVDAATPPFEAVRDAVLRDWTRRTAGDLTERQFERLLARYDVVRPESPSGSTQQP